ncbi:MAG: hypothetical protein KDA87_25905 [Planctomycetales bacterium]|nr:hypothetical protein [Planctomycetales bacterium]
MRISSRTPEGEPLQCRICTRTSLVLVSDPPGDAVCPNCGCHDWIIDSNRQIDLDFDTSASSVTEWIDQVNQSLSLMAIAQSTAAGLNRMLRPAAVAIWQVLETPDAPRDIQFLVRIGQVHEADFMLELLEKGQSIVRQTELPTGWVTRIGSLQFIESPDSLTSRFSIIEVSFSGKINSDSQETALRITTSMGAIAASRARRSVLSTNGD